MLKKATTLCAGVSVCAILSAVAGSTQAQTQSAPPPAAGAEPVASLDDVIVTAQRRSQSVQKSSLSIEVLTSETLQRSGVTQARDLATAVTGVQIAQAGAATQIYVRGVGDFGSTSQTNPAVAFNVDGVYVARPGAIEGNFYDLERVEVLKGPQGTLYGRNATGGAINVITAKPRLGMFEGRGSAEIGNFDKLLGELAVNLPIGDTFAVRLAAQVVDRGPYVTYNYGDDKHESVRLQALWQPDDRMSLRVGGDFTHVGGGGPEFVPLQAIPGVDPWTSVTDPLAANYFNQQAAGAGLCAPAFAVGVSFPGACPALSLPIGPGGALVPVPQAQLAQSFAGERGRIDNTFWSIFAELNYDLGFANLTILPAYRSAEQDYSTYPGGFLFDSSAGGRPETSRATSIEARLTRDTDRFKGVLGLYYFKEEQAGLAEVYAGFVQRVLIAQSIDTDNYAAFGQGAYSVTDTLRVIGGLRYTSDKREIAPVTYQLPGAAAYAQLVAAGCTPTRFEDTAYIGCTTNQPSGSGTFEEMTWKVGLEYDVAPRSMLYATISTGFKAGGFYNGVAPSGSGLGSYQPETLTAYEIGSRNRFLDNRLQINFEAFYYDYKDHQEPVIILDGGTPATIVQSTQNAGSGEILGAGADVVYRFTANDTLHVGLEYLDTEYTEFRYTSPIVNGQRFVGPNGSGCAVTATPAQETVDCSGFPLTRSPKWSGVVSYAHIFDLPNGATLEAGGNLQFSSKRYLATDYLPVSLAPSYQTYNADLTYRPGGADWSITAYGRNLSDEVIYTGAIKSPYVPNFSSASIAAPRTYGVRVNFAF